MTDAKPGRRKRPFEVEVNGPEGFWIAAYETPEAGVRVPLVRESSAAAESAVKKLAEPGQYRIIQVSRGPIEVTVESKPIVTMSDLPF